MRKCGRAESVWWICVSCVLGSEYENTRNEVWVREYGKVVLLGYDIVSQLYCDSGVGGLVKGF